MIDQTRRMFLTGALTSGTAMLAAPAVAENIFRLPYEWLPTDVTIEQGPSAGSIIVDTDNTWLYLVTGDTSARRYKIAVGAAGRQFKGTAMIRRRAEWPSWTPTRNMIRVEPDVYGPYRSGLPGGHPRNPMGARALYLYQARRDTMYRIHGTQQPWTIGQSFSSGCVRLINDHIEDLYDRVSVGTQVTVY